MVRSIAAAALFAAIATAGASSARTPATRTTECSGAEVRLLLDGFARAFSRGDFARLDRIFAKEPAFEWYSTGKPGARLGAAAYDRSSLIRYFRTRHARGDRIRFLAVRSGYDKARQLRHFGFVARRSTRDFRNGRWFKREGKGAVDCSRRPLRVIVLSFQ